MLLLQILRTNGGCEFPCLWGIRPGEDTKVTLVDKLGPILSIASYTGEITYTRSELIATSTVLPSDLALQNRFYAGFEINRNNVNVQVGLDFYFQKDTDSIDYISITTRAFQFTDDDFDYAFDSQEFHDILPTLSLQGILARYGPPSQIVIRVDNNIAEPDSPDFFNIWLVYRDQNTLATVWGNADVGIKIISFCPGESFSSVWVFDPAGKVGLQNTIEEQTGHWENDFPASSRYQTLKVALGLEDEEFFENYSNSFPPCVETPVDSWPY